jgi:hypothetical protein
MREEAQDFEEALNEFFLQICYALRINKMVELLIRLLRRL